MNKIITYIGRRGTPTVKHYYLDGENTVSYKRVLVPAAKIGARIEVVENENGSISLAPDKAPRIVGYLNDEEQVARWEALSYSDVVNANRRKNEKLINREHATPTEKAIKTLRIATIGMNQSARAAFLAYIIQELS